MSRAERTPRPDLDIDALLNEHAETSAKTKESLNQEIFSQTPFRPVSSAEIKHLTDEVRFHPQRGNLVEKLNDLKQTAIKLVLIGENGKLVPKGSESFPGSRALVNRAYEVKRLDNDLDTINFRNDVLSHVLSTNPDKIKNSNNALTETKLVQKRFTLIKDAFAQLPPRQRES